MVNDVLKAKLEAVFRTLALLSVLASFQIVFGAAATYRAAVVEHVPIVLNRTSGVSRSDAIYLMRRNLAQYEAHIVDAKNQNADVVVFPEDGLYGATFPTRHSATPYLESLPEKCNGCRDQDSQINPCLSPTEFNTTATPILFALSCLARKHSTAIVVNMGDTQPCRESDAGKCPSDGHWQFNTQVAVGPDGELLAKYHKTNLFPMDLIPFDYPVDQAPQFWQLELDGGRGTVTFGMFICFDIFFEYPAQFLAHELGIRDFTFPTWWVNPAVVPLMSATEVQQAWSRQMNANLLASNAGYGFQSSGSGLYVAGGNISALPSPVYFNPVNNSNKDTLLVRTMPVLPTPDLDLTRKPAHGDRHLKMRQPDRGYPGSSICTTTSFTPQVNAAQRLMVSHGQLECSLRVTTSANPQNTTFSLLACNGADFQGLQDVSICAVEPCGGSDCDSEIVISSQGTRFSALELIGNFNSTGVIFPIIAADNAQILPASAAQLTTTSPAEGSSNNMTAWTLTGEQNVLNAVLYQQWVSQTPQKPTRGKHRDDDKGLSTEATVAIVLGGIVVILAGWCLWRQFKKRRDLQHQYASMQF